MKLNEIVERPLTFKDVFGDMTGGHVIRDIDADHRELESLEGAPKTCAKLFLCNANNLTSLMYGPEVVGDRFNCSYNRLSSLDGSPKTCKVFVCAHNELTSLHDIHKHIVEVHSSVNFSFNPLTKCVLGLLKIKSLKMFVMASHPKLEKIINKYLPEGDIVECQQELIEAGLEDYAQL